MADTSDDQPHDADVAPHPDELRARNEQLTAELEQLRARAEGLEAENDTLRRENERSQTAVITGSESRGAMPPTERTRKPRGRGWTVLATVLVIIGAILAPVAVVSTWAQRQLSDTDYFVSTFAPLAQQPAVQDLVTTQATQAIDQSIDINGLTKQVFDGIADAGIPPKAADALKGLAGPAADGIRGLIQGTISKFVQSQTFADLWTQTLRTAHNQLGQTMNGDPNALITIGANGAIGLQLGPVIQAVKKVLVDQGLTIAQNIPVIKKTIVIAHTSSATLVQTMYGLTIALGTWLPWLVLVLLAAGVLVARRRSTALVWAAVALFISMVLVALGITVGKTVFVASVASVMSSGAASVIYGLVLKFASDIVLAIAVLAATVAVVAYLAGPFRVSAKLRSLANAGFAGLRAIGDKHGLGTAATGRWIYRQRVLLRVAVAVIAAVIILFVRPLTPPLIIWTAVIAVLVIIGLGIVERPDADEPSEIAPATA